MTAETVAPGADAAAKARVAPVLTAISSDVPMPQVSTRRGNNSIYPFEKLEVGQSFGILNKTAKNMGSVVTSANKRFMVDAVDSEGKPIYKTQEVKAADGTVSKVPTLEREKAPGKVFAAFDVDPKTDPQGASVRVFRTK